MIAALLRSVLTKVEYEVPHPGEPAPDPVENDVDCNVWGGLLEFSVLENGSYPAAVPFIDLHLAFGATVTPDILVYDGVGGWCGAGTPPATLNMRVNVSGLDSAGNPVFGSATYVAPFPGSDPPHPPPIEFCVLVNVDNPIKRKRARLWFYFAVRNMC